MKLFSKILECILITPREAQTSIDKIDFSSLPDWSSAHPKNFFEIIRDRRFLRSDENPVFLRRIPWFYVENGCYLRAALIGRLVREMNLPGIKKLFIFGQMKFLFHPHPKIEKEVTFKDHVAAAFRIEKDVFVIDPPMNFSKPLSLTDWISSLFLKSDHKNFHLCLAGEYTLSHNCPIDAKSPQEEVGMKNGEVREVSFFTQEFLKKESELLQQLGLSEEEFLCSPSLVKSGNNFA